MKKLLLLLIGVIAGLSAQAAMTFYYDNSTTNWGTPYVHYWQEGGSSTTWHGKAMKNIKGTNLWTYTVEESWTPNRAIFNDNGSNQSNNIENPVSGQLYKCDGNKQNVYSKGTFGVQIHIESGNEWKDVPLTYDSSSKIWKSTATTFESGKKFGLKFCGGKEQVAWVSGDATVSNANQDYFYNISSNNNSTCNLSGSYIVVLDPLKNCIRFETSSVSNTYTIYFYDTKDLKSVKAHIWSKTEGAIYGYKDGKESMTATGKYINNGGNYYPLYEYTFTTTKTPYQLLFYKTDDNDKQTGNVDFVNGGFYTNGATKPQVGLTILDNVRDPNKVTIYMHWKEDVIREALNKIPYCHLYKAGDDTSNLPYYNNGRGDERMKLVDARYQIWAYEIDKNDISKYNRVIFYYTKASDGKTEVRYTTDVNKGAFNDAKLYDYIYTNHNGNYAVQTYLSYDEFQMEAARFSNGQSKLYVLGAKEYTMTYENAAGQTVSEALSWTAEEGKTLAPYTPNDPLYFIELTPDKNKVTEDNGIGIKFSWINVKDWREKSTAGINHADRDWATFDLGCIGVDDVTCSKHSDWDVTLQTDGQFAFFTANKSLPLLEYNQYNWQLKKADMAASKYWVVVDMHATCRTVTLCDFDPQSKLEVKDATFYKTTIADNAEACRFHHDHLHAAADNGHILMKNVNYCNGSMYVTGVAKSSIDGKFVPTYTVSLNGEHLFDHEGYASGFKMDYMPLADASALGVSVRYNSNVTKLNFHIRPGVGNLQAVDDFMAPSGQIIAPRYYNNQNGYYNIHTQVKYGFDSENPYNVYSDFEVNSNVDEAEKAGKIARVDDNLKNAGLAAWNEKEYAPCTDETFADWAEDMNNWSMKILPSEAHLPLVFDQVAMTDDYPSVNGVAKLPEARLSGNVYAVYPFIYKSVPTVEVITSEPVAHTAALARVNQGEVPAALEGFSMSYITKSAAVAGEIAAGGNALLGIENVAAEAEGEAEYYTISGVRVQGTPAPGLYIMRQGTKATKVLVR